MNRLGRLKEIVLGTFSKKGVLAVEQDLSARPQDDREQLALETARELAEGAKHLRAAHDFYRRRSEEYFGLIEQLEKERNQWKEKWFFDGAAHQSAQAILENALEQSRQSTHSYAKALNEARALLKLEPVALPLPVQAPPMGIAEATRAHLERQKAEAPVDTNAAERRDQITHETADAFEHELLVMDKGSEKA